MIRARFGKDDYAWTRTEEYAREMRASHEADREPAYDAGTVDRALVLLKRATHKHLLEPCGD